ncbi:Uncharacterized protein HZ326_28361 [Fusarium oxysporum f. sp. albedinis]|nr:Uncharacterized protein HZ326_28361 [Fusarium oxysporum f. sp. albedinis]
MDLTAKNLLLGPIFAGLAIFLGNRRSPVHGRSLTSVHLCTLPMLSAISRSAILDPWVSCLSMAGLLLLAHLCTFSRSSFIGT